MSQRAVWDALGAEMRNAILEAARLTGFPPEHWQRVGELVRVFVPLAVQRRAIALRRDEGCSWDAAVTRACEDLGQDPESHLRKLRRWREQADGRTLRPEADAPSSTAAQPTA